MYQILPRQENSMTSKKLWPQLRNVDSNVIFKNHHINPVSPSYLDLGVTSKWNLNVQPYVAFLIFSLPTPAADGPAPRQCHLKIWPDFNGYGFNLHEMKGRPGHYIGNVDDDSPAHTAGLKQNDRIIEVNGQCIGSDDHSQVGVNVTSKEVNLVPHLDFSLVLYTI